MEAGECCILRDRLRSDLDWEQAEEIWNLDTLILFISKNDGDLNFMAWEDLIISLPKGPFSAILQFAWGGEAPPTWAEPQRGGQHLNGGSFSPCGVSAGG